MYTFLVFTKTTSGLRRGAFAPTSSFGFNYYSVIQFFLKSLFSINPPRFCRRRIETERKIVEFFRCPGLPPKKEAKEGGNCKAHLVFY